MLSDFLFKDDKLSEDMVSIFGSVLNEEERTLLERYEIHFFQKCKKCHLSIDSLFLDVVSPITHQAVQIEYRVERGMIILTQYG